MIILFSSFYPPAQNKLYKSSISDILKTLHTFKQAVAQVFCPLFNPLPPASEVLKAKQYFR